MLTTSRLVLIATLSSLLAAGCGGGSSGTDDGPDAASNADADAGGPGESMDAPGDTGRVDSAVSPGPIDGAVPPAADAGDTTHDGGKGTDGAACGASADCQNAHCVSGVCCASACAAPAACQTAAGATCAGGSTCVYANAADNTACDDGNACTKTDVCANGTCVGGGAVSCDDDQCNMGVCDPATGNCSKQPAHEAVACDDGNACTSGETCRSGACGSGITVSCDDGNPCTDDTCDTVLGCKSHNNTAACDDGDPCTVSDVCSAGLCRGSPKDCSGQGDACNVGVCNAGTCGKSPKADNTACNDNLVCTITDVCTGGVCRGSGNSCGANASACAEGPPKTCTCTGSFVSSGGQCVPSTNECALSPCVAVATCNDPSSAANDFVCTCPTGFSGDGKTAGTGCTNVDDCVGNPCGAGLGTCVDGINAHTCNCNTGYVSVNGACVCDMNGTFASKWTLTASWPVVNVDGLNVFEKATNVVTSQWAIRTQSYSPSGHLVITTTQCGGTAADLCGELSPIDDAYAEYLPSTIYGLASMPVGTLAITLTSPLPGHAYTEPQTATLLGISLADPLGAWPAAAANVGAGANQTNGAIWVDSDNDGFAGVTSYSVPPGGILHTAPPFPIQDYPATSSACPRDNAAQARLSYNYLPGLDGFKIDQVKRLYTGARIISSMSGTVTSCDGTGATLIQGTLGGPDNGQVRADARVSGCVRVNGSGESDCSTAVASQYDGQNQSDHVTSGTFVLKRVASTATCADVRAMTFP